MRHFLALLSLLLASAAYAQQSSPDNVNGGIYNATPPTLSDKQRGVFQLDTNGNLNVNVKVGGGGGGGAVTQGTVPWVDSITMWGGGTLGAMANYGTSPGAVLVPGVNAFITNPVAVTGTFWPYTLGQQAMAASVPVVLPSDPDLRPNSTNVTVVDSGSTTTAGYNSVILVTGAATAGSAAAQAINGQSSATITVTGTWTGTLAFEISGDGGTTWVQSATRQRGSGGVLGPRTGTTTGNGVFVSDVSSMTNMRVRATVVVTGTAAVKFVFSSGVGPVQIQTPVSFYDNTSNQSGTIKPASTAATATDPAVVVALSPNNGLAATENHLGEVGGNILPITNDLTTTNATTTPGQSIGGLQTLANAVRVSAALGSSGTSGMIQSVIVSFKDAVTTSQIDVFYFNASPSGSTCTNDSAFILADADRDKVIGVVHVTDFTAGTTAVVSQAMNQALPFGVASATSVFACLVARGSFAITGTANASLITRILRN